jgi:hypothetical protein
LTGNHREKWKTKPTKRVQPISAQNVRDHGKWEEDAIPSVMERTSYQSQKKIQNIQDVVGENWADDTYYS